MSMHAVQNSSGIRRQRVDRIGPYLSKLCEDPRDLDDWRHSPDLPASGWRRRQRDSRQARRLGSDRDGLVMNAPKHAFPDDKAKSDNVAMTWPGTIEAFGSQTMGLARDGVFAHQKTDSGTRASLRARAAAPMPGLKPLPGLRARPCRSSCHFSMKEIRRRLNGDHLAPPE